MRKRVLDTSILSRHWHKCRAPQLATNTAQEARGWAKRLVALYDTEAIVTPIYLEMVAGVCSRHELQLTRADLGVFRCIDERRIGPSDWDAAIQWAERFCPTTKAKTPPPSVRSGRGRETP
jgi:hypothetical protein